MTIDSVFVRLQIVARIDAAGERIHTGPPEGVLQHDVVLFPGLESRQLAIGLLLAIDQPRDGTRLRFAGRVIAHFGGHGERLMDAHHRPIRPQPRNREVGSVRPVLAGLDRLPSVVGTRACIAVLP